MLYPARPGGRRGRLPADASAGRPTRPSPPKLWQDVVGVVIIGTSLTAAYWEVVHAKAVEHLDPTSRPGARPARATLELHGRSVVERRRDAVRRSLVPGVVG